MNVAEDIRRIRAHLNNRPGEPKQPLSRGPRPGLWCAQHGANFLSTYSHQRQGPRKGVR